MRRSGCSARSSKSPSYTDPWNPYEIALLFRVAAVLENWYRARARVKFSERLGHVFLLFERCRRAMPPIRVQRLVQRWGSLGPSGLMLLNTRVIQAPLPCIDYVITHKLLVSLGVV